MKLTLPEALVVVTLVGIVALLAIKLYERHTYILECEAYKNESIVQQNQIKQLREEQRKNNVVQRAKWQIGNEPYIYGDNDCFDQTTNLSEWLIDEGIDTYIAEGNFWLHNIWQHHYWTLIPVDSVTGRYINPTQPHNITEIRYNDTKCVCK